MNYLDYDWRAVLTLSQSQSRNMDDWPYILVLMFSVTPMPKSQLIRVLPSTYVKTCRDGREVSKLLSKISLGLS